MERLRGAGPVFLYGGSYGTYLAQRFIQIHPDLPDGVILEGISAPGQGFVGYEAGMNAAGQDLFAVCSADLACRSHFDGDPWTVASDLVAAMDAGHCPTLGVDGLFTRQFLAALLFYNGIRDLVPALVFRMDRCSTEDVDAVVSIYNRMFGGGGATLGMANDGLGDNDALFFHVALSEMWPDGAPSLAETEANFLSYTMSTGLEIRLAKMLDEQGWPTFPQDEHYGGFSDYDGPLLMLQGGLDPATNIEQSLAVGEHYDGPTQAWAEFPFGAHDIVGAAPLADGGDCARDLYLDFLEAPEAPLDLGCVDDALPPAFDGYPGWAAWLFGTDDAWGD